MKKFLLLMSVIFVAFQFIGHSQTALEVVWEKTAPIPDIKLIRFAPDGKSIYCANKNSIVRISAENGDVLWSANSLSYISDIDVAGSYLAASSNNGDAGLWNTQTNEFISNLKPDSTGNYSADYIAFSPNGINLLLSFYKNKQQYIAVYDLQKQQVTKLIPCAYRITTMRFSHNGKTFATSGYLTVKPDPYTTENHDRLYLYDAETFEQIAIINDVIGENDGYKEIKYSFNDSQISCVRYAPNDVKVVDLSTKLIKFSENGQTSYKEIVATNFIQDTEGLILGYANRWTGKYTLSLRHSDNEIVNYSVESYRIEVNNSNDNFRIFTPGYKITLLKPSTTGIPENGNSLATLISENNEIILKCTNIPNQKISIFISNVEGKQVYSNSFEIAEQSGQIKLGYELPSGIYLYKITSTEKVFTGKFVVDR